jgi:hypothetical protein
MKLRGPSLHAAGMTIPLAMKDLRLSGCPVAQTNPYSQMTAEQRLRFALWHSRRRSGGITRNVLVCTAGEKHTFSAGRPSKTFCVGCRSCYSQRDCRRDIF